MEPAVAAAIAISLTMSIATAVGRPPVSMMSSKERGSVRDPSWGCPTGQTKTAPRSASSLNARLPHNDGRELKKGGWCSPNHPPNRESETGRALAAAVPVISVRGCAGEGALIVKRKSARGSIFPSSVPTTQTPMNSLSLRLVQISQVRSHFTPPEIWTAPKPYCLSTFSKVCYCTHLLPRCGRRQRPGSRGMILRQRSRWLSHW